MFFILSKVLNPLLEPLTWVLVCGVLVTWKSKGIVRRWLIGGLSGLVLLTNPWISDKVVRAWEVGDDASLIQPGGHDAIVALGGGCVTLRDAKGERLQVGETFDRVFQAVRLYKQGAAKKIILTGSKDPAWVDLPSEAEASRSVLVSFGIPHSDIIAVPSARNTFEEARALADMVEKQPAIFPRKKLILVTSATHLRRAIWCFSRCGLRITPQPANLRSGADTPPGSIPSLGPIFPSAEVLVTWGQLFHEWVGFGVYWLKY